jgi:hypothetical protein
MRDDTEAKRPATASRQGAHGAVAWRSWRIAWALALARRLDDERNSYCFFFFFPFGFGVNMCVLRSSVSSVITGTKQK